MAEDEQVQDDQREADDQDQDDTHESEQLGDKGREALKREREARKAADKRAADLEKRIAEFEKAQKDRDAETARQNGEWEKVATEAQAELETLKAQIAERDLRDRKAAAAKAAGLPDDMADRLRGDTDEELEADAKALAKHLRTPEAPDTDAGDRTPRGTKKPDKRAYSDPAKWGLRSSPRQ